MNEQKYLSFAEGLKDAVPIALGYLSVSFGFGIMAVQAGIPLWAAVLISLSNVTSAGQVAGVTIISAAGGYFEMALTQFIINLRYSLMSLSLTQKLDKTFKTPARLGFSFCITDEIFAVSSGKGGHITKKYLSGLMALPYFTWSLGTFLGAFAGEILPEAIKNALGMAIYGMFIAIIVPPLKKNKGVAAVVITSVALSCLFAYVPFLKNVSGGFVIIICGIIASLAGALLFPIKEKEDEET
ncbi:MAG: AzlC family ABC transporter permease [Lachnospiraceae bacterium]|nr:AzlC family ABC transporter permease [Lachnospiraceae bacterium]